MQESEQRITESVNFRKVLFSNTRTSQIGRISSIVVILINDVIQSLEILDKGINMMVLFVS